MDASDNRPRVGVACFIWKDGKFLVHKRIGSHGHGTWSVPGGHLEFGESFEACARREVREEVGLEIQNVRMLAVTNDIFEDEHKHYISIWLEADWKAGEARSMEPDKGANLTWRTFSDLPQPLFEPCWQNLRQARPELFA
ncbi:MAG TPA: NUDIX domain-containing protein [Candidatus Saccharimonadales bacterium]